MIEYYVFRLPVKNQWKFMPWDKSFDLTWENYVLVYVGEIKDGEDVLERIYEMLNVYQPADYRIPSLSISDVVMLPEKEEFWYVDSIGFKRVWEE